MNARASHHVLKAALVVAAALGFVAACSATATDHAGTVRQALGDGGAPRRGNEYSVVVTPELALAPSARTAPALTYDAAAGVAVLVGGEGSSVNDVWETWTYDGAWTKRCDRNCAVRPAGRFISSLVYVPDRRVSVLFAGVSASNEFTCDTWEWESAAGTWTPRAEPTCDTDLAAPRAGHAATAFADKAVVFGGFVNVAVPTPRSNDLLAWDGNGWSRLCDAECEKRSAATPERRAYTSLSHAKLARGDVLFLFGGDVGTTGPGTASNDLWAFDVAAARWTELCTTSPCKEGRPPPRTRHGAIYDPVRGRLVVHAGCNGVCNAFLSDAWEYDPESDRWAPLPDAAPNALPPPRARFGIAFDSGRRRIVEFGGQDGSTYLGSTVELYTRGGACTAARECHTSACQGNRCVEPCSDSGASGPCVNGYACNTACTEPCQSCARVPGTCTAVTSGPDDEDGPAESKCTDGRECVPGATEFAGACRLAAGRPCVLGVECATGICSALAPNVCVDVTCNEPCQSPRGGSCVPRDDGSEPPDLGCLGLRCDGRGSCLDACTDTGDCVPNYYCEVAVGKCKLYKEPGASCQMGAECRSGNCVDRVCCDKACDGACDECGKDGVCFQRTGKVEPLAGHPACGGAGECRGYCDGRSVCSYPGESTECGVSACAGRDYALAANVCDGDGRCVQRKPASCQPFACNEETGECFRECNRDTDCRSGAVCRIEGDGRGSCQDQGIVCADDWSVRSLTGDIESCGGRPCRNDECLPPDCVPGVPGECAPGYVCRGRRCEETGSLPRDDAGAKPPPSSADSGARKAPGEADGGDVVAEGGGTSCAVERLAARSSRGALSALSLATLFICRRIRRQRKERVRIVP